MRAPVQDFRLLFAYTHTHGWGASIDHEDEGARTNMLFVQGLAGTPTRQRALLCQVSAPAPGVHALHGDS